MLPLDLQSGLMLSWGSGAKEECVSLRGGVVFVIIIIRYDEQKDNTSSDTTRGS